MRKGIKITIIVLVSLAVICTLTYQVGYNYIAPKVFDLIIEKNSNFIRNLDNSNNEQTQTKEENNSTNNSNKDALIGNDAHKSEDENSNNAQNSPKDNGSGNDGTKKKGYSTMTSIGELTDADLTLLLKKISPKDKTRIITICKNAVAPADYPRFSKMYREGMKGDDMAYAESYLRKSVSAGEKQEILDIVAKYIR